MATTTIQRAASQTTNTPDFSKYSFDKLEPYVHPPETKEDLPWSELVTLDLEDYGRPGGKERLAKQLEHAVHHVGFVCTGATLQCHCANPVLVLRQELWPYSRAS
jgi:hypothetical protein